MTIVNSSFSDEQRPRTIGLYFAAGFATSAPLPLLGGMLVNAIG